MIPTLKDFMEAGCRWFGEHEGIRYELSWHGCSDYNPQGTWCYYLHLTDEQFYPEDWAKLRLEHEDKEFYDSWCRHYSYDEFPDLDAHSGWTFGEMSLHLGRDGKEHEHVKVGCDYAHLWDRESDFPDGRASVERDAKHSIDLLIKMFPRRRWRCGYSGRWDDEDQFYIARNGRRVHKSQEEKLRADKWDTWWPADAACTIPARQTVEEKS